MRNARYVLIHFVAVLILVVYVQSEYIVLRDNGPVVSGANLTIWATVYNEDHEKASGEFVYQWEDDALPKHFHVEHSESPDSEWNVSYPSPQYYPSTYVIQVKVDVKPHWYSVWSRWSERKEINITDLLNGNLNVYQNTTFKTNEQFVSNKQPVMHKVELQQPDLDFLRNNATQISSYWFIDCHYYGVSSDFTFNYTFKDVGSDHDIAALVVASYDKPVTTTTSISTFPSSPLPPSNSTTTPSVTNSSVSSHSPNTNSSTTAANTTSVHPITSTTPMTPIKINATNATATDVGPIPPDFLAPFVCLNTSVVPRDENKTYGYFQKHISVRAPVENLAYTGTNWIQPGDILDLHVSCNGSGSFQWCAYSETPDYNVTGNEKCLLPREYENCSFDVTHLPSKNMTMVIVVSNVVSKGVLGVKINMYNAQKHAQLSVIIVPVTCSLIVVVLIVFGVAYYVQSRARFTVEIADFDFGQTDDLEYKTFRERLLDAVNNAVNRVEILDEENTSTSHGQKYGSLQ